VTASQQPAPLQGHLHHLQLFSPDPYALAVFYSRCLGMTVTPLGDRWLCQGPERNLILARGASGSLGFAAYAVACARPGLSRSTATRRCSRPSLWDFWIPTATTSCSASPRPRRRPPEPPEHCRPGCNTLFWPAATQRGCLTSTVTLWGSACPIESWIQQGRCVLAFCARTMNITAWPSFKPTAIGSTTIAMNRPIGIRFATGVTTSRPCTYHLSGVRGATDPATIYSSSCTIRTATGWKSQPNSSASLLIAPSARGRMRSERSTAGVGVFYEAKAIALAARRFPGRLGLPF
jgi:hypothetical protein